MVRELTEIAEGFRAEARSLAEIEATQREIKAALDEILVVCDVQDVKQEVAK